MKNYFKKALALLMALSLIMIVGCSKGKSTKESDQETVSASDTTDVEASSNEDTSSQDAESSSDNEEKDDDKNNNSSKGENKEKDKNNNSSKNENKDKNNNSSKGENKDKDKNTNSSKEENKNDKENTSEEQVKKLTVWDVSNNPSMAAAAVKFEREHKNVKINVVNTGYTSLSSLKSAIASSTAPDIVVMDHVYLVSAGANGYLLDLNKYGAKNIKSQFMSTCWDASGRDGKIYGLPFDANTICFIYNKERFIEANAKVPSNYNELKAAAAALKTKGTVSSPITFSFNETGAHNKNFAAFQFFFWLWRNGGEILSSDYKKATFNSQAGVDALQQIVDLYKNDYVSDKYDQASFIAGNIGIMENGTWMYEGLFTGSNKGRYGVALMPELKKGVKQYSGLGLYCYGVTSGSKNPELAYEFISEFCTTSAYQVTFAKSAGRIPSLLAAQKNAYYQTAEWQTFIKQLGMSKARPGVNNWDNIESYIADSVYQAISGKSTPKEVLDAAAKYVNTMLARTYN